MTMTCSHAPVVCLAGPTAAGKSASVLALARRWPIEIINVDSATIYRDMDIGTAKPSAAERARAPQHLLDIRDPAQSYSAAGFVTDTRALIQEIRARGNIPVLAGGTMMYFKALRDGLDDLPRADPALREELAARAAREGWPALHATLAQLDPVTAARLAPGDSQRIQRALEICMLTARPMSALLSRKRKEKADDATQDSDSPGGFATGCPAPGSNTPGRAATRRSAPRDADAASCEDAPGRERWLTISLEPSDRLALHARIAQRFDAMMDAGLLQEVARLRTRPDLHAGLPSIRCVGYRQMWSHLAGDIDLDTAREQAHAATRQLAKRQLTWLRSQPDRIVIDCLQADAADQVVAQCARIFG